jgi:hypothetical protein
MDIEAHLRKLAAVSERRGLDDVSANIARAIREHRAGLIREAAKESNIEVESWPDFLNWWNNNRGQNLIYIFMDQYGADSEQVRLVKKLVRDAEKHEKDLHEFYRTLRDLASQQMDMDPAAAGGAGGAGGGAAAAGGAEKDEAAAPTPAPSEDETLNEIALDLGE